MPEYLIIDRESEEMIDVIFLSEDVKIKYERSNPSVYLQEPELSLDDSELYEEEDD